MTDYKLSTKSYARLVGVHPELMLVITESIKNSPIDFGIPADGGVRTDERQHEMFLDPAIKTKCDGYHIKSRHQIKPDGYGHAFDVFAYVNGSASWEPHHLAMVAGCILTTAKRLKKEGKISIDLYWGGQFGCADFTGWDYPHYQCAY